MRPKRGNNPLLNLRRLFWVLFGASVVLLTGLLYWGIGPTLACSFPSSQAPQAGTSVYRIESDGRQRCYILVLPPDFDPQRPIPLILSLHGFSSNPHGQRSFSRWDLVAAQAYAAVVYPQGTGFPQRWNADPEYTLEGADDVKFIRELIKHLADQLPVDRTRLFVTGFSNGGAMTLRLACERNLQIAAIGTVAAPVSPTLAACELDRPVPLIAFHGTLDPVVPYTGRSAGEPGQSPSIAQERMPNHALSAPNQWVHQWAIKNGCVSEATPLAAHGEVTGVVYHDCLEAASVLFYSIQGGGHTWPGGGKIPFVGKTTEDIRASESMWAFFQQHPLP
ncbi:MAG: hypothetical protein E4G99_04445 [Anaerolineales bacterium]|nr:MAG: hypothetical protein E4G99_04445 [Anaerolineales bacterium]